MTPEGFPADYSLKVYEEIDSTNSEAMRLAKNGESNRFWIWSKKQTQGKGRSGRSWISMEGNLHASLLLKLSCDLNIVAQLSLLAGVAAYDALVTICGDPVAKQIHLKWPNDLLLNEAKLGGILLESSQQSSDDTIVVAIGTGINLRTHPELDYKRTTNLCIQGQDIEPEEALTALAQTTAKWLSIWKQGQNFDQIREAWTLRGQSIGSSIEVHSGSSVVQGHYAGLNQNGGMILQVPSGEYKEIHFGDVTLPGEKKKKV